MEAGKETAQHKNADPTMGMTTTRAGAGTYGNQGPNFITQGVSPRRDVVYSKEQSLHQAESGAEAPAPAESTAALRCSSDLQGECSPPSLTSLLHIHGLPEDRALSSKTPSTGPSNLLKVVFHTKLPQPSADEILFFSNKAKLLRNFINLCKFFHKRGTGVSSSENVCTVAGYRWASQS